MEWLDAPTKLLLFSWKKLTIVWINIQRDFWMKIILKSLFVSKMLSIRVLFLQIFCKKILRFFKIMLEYHLWLSKLTCSWYFFMCYFLLKWYFQSRQELESAWWLLLQFKRVRVGFILLSRSLTIDSILFFLFILFYFPWFLFFSFFYF